MGNINFNEEIKDKWVKIAGAIILLVVLSVLIILTIITVKKINQGEHVKVFGLEYNIPQSPQPQLSDKDNPKPDTVISNTPLNLPKPKYKKPSYLYKSEPNNIGLSHSIPKIDTVKKPLSVAITAKNVLNGNVSGGTVQVGDTYNGVKQRHATVDLLNQFILLNTNKLPFKVKCEMSNTESKILSGEIIDALKQRGYIVHWEYYMATVPVLNNSDFEYSEVDGNFLINVYPVPIKQ